MKKQIKIDDLIPFMKKGWICCDISGRWRWYRKKPELFETPIIDGWVNDEFGIVDFLGRMFDILPFDGDWKKSLRRVK